MKEGGKYIPGWELARVLGGKVEEACSGARGIQLCESREWSHWVTKYRKNEDRSDWPSSLRQDLMCETGIRPAGSVVNG